MGGFGSGRHGNTVTAEATASYVISISSLAPEFQQGRCVTCVAHFERGKFPILITVDLTTEWNCFVELIHKTRDYREGDRIVIGRVALAWTVPTYGGRRWWFLCPRTGCRTTKLFLPNGGWHFLSRQAYRLGYASQRENRRSYRERRTAAVNRLLVGEGRSTSNIAPPKPEWMRSRTYARWIERRGRAGKKASDHCLGRLS